MATFREIDEAILALVDEDGEIMDVKAFEALQMEREQKAENMALWALDLKDEQKAIKEEIARLQARLRASEHKEEKLRGFLAEVLQNQKMRTPRVSVSFRDTRSVTIEDEDAVRKWAMKDPQGEDVLRYKEPEISKSEIRRIIEEEHGYVPGACITLKQSTIIK